MQPQFIRTEAGEELVVLTRRAYDALLARAGDEAAEDRMTALMAEEHLSGPPTGPAAPLWLAKLVAEHGSPIKGLRKHRGITQAGLANFAALPQSYISEIESGAKAPSAQALVRIAAALDCDPAWLE